MGLFESANFLILSPNLFFNSFDKILPEAISSPYENPPGTAKISYDKILFLLFINSFICTLSASAPHISNADCNS